MKKNPVNRFDVLKTLSWGYNVPICKRKIELLIEQYKLAFSLIASGRNQVTKSAISLPNFKIRDIIIFRVTKWRRSDVFIVNPNTFHT